LRENKLTLNPSLSKRGTLKIAGFPPLPFAREGLSRRDAFGRDELKFSVMFFTQSLKSVLEKYFLSKLFGE
jgi:hypothetical protein